MAKKLGDSKKVTALRREAEARLRVTQRDMAALPAQKAQQLVHELQVHQIELEMQNEELRRTQEQLEAARDRYADLFEFAPTGYLTLDPQGTILSANLRAGMMLDRNRNELIGQELARLIMAEYLDGFRRHCQALAKTGERQSCEVCIRSQTGAVRWLHLESAMLAAQPGSLAQWQMALTDLSSHKEAALILQEQERRLRELSVKLIKVQEEERRRIARELHDDFTQRLAAIAMELGGLVKHCPEAVTGWVKPLLGLQTTIESVADGLQKMAHELHPSILEHVGLEAAIREHTDEFAARTGLSVDLSLDPVANGLPLGHATCLYRVLQESLQNVRKHAHATSVLIRLLRTGHGVGLCIHDDGRGFEARQAGAHLNGLGLTSMAERLGLVQGTFRIRTKPHDGTEVHAWVPFPHEEAAKGQGGDSSAPQ